MFANNSVSICCIELKYGPKVLKYMPLMDFYGIPGTVRASFSIYNNHSEVDKLVDAIKLAIKMLK